MLTACWLAPIVLNIWSYLRLPDVYYLVAGTNLARVRFPLTRITDLARPHTPSLAFVYFRDKRMGQETLLDLHFKAQHRMKEL